MLHFKAKLLAALDAHLQQLDEAALFNLSAEVAVGAVVAVGQLGEGLYQVDQHHLSFLGQLGEVRGQHYPEHPFYVFGLSELPQPLGTVLADVLVQLLVAELSYS